MKQTIQAMRRNHHVRGVWDATLGAAAAGVIVALTMAIGTLKDSLVGGWNLLNPWELVFTFLLTVLSLSVPVTSASLFLVELTRVDRDRGRLSGGKAVGLGAGIGALITLALVGTMLSTPYGELDESKAPWVSFSLILVGAILGGGIAWRIYRDAASLAAIDAAEWQAQMANRLLRNPLIRGAAVGVTGAAGASAAFTLLFYAARFTANVIADGLFALDEFIVVGIFMMFLTFLVTFGFIVIPVGLVSLGLAAVMRIRSIALDLSNRIAFALGVVLSVPIAWMFNLVIADYPFGHLIGPRGDVAAALFPIAALFGGLIARKIYLEIPRSDLPEQGVVG